MLWLWTRLLHLPLLVLNENPHLWILQSIRLLTIIWLKESVGSSPNLLFLGLCFHKYLSEFLAAHGSFRVCRQAAVESSTAVREGWLYQLQSQMISGGSDNKESACNAGDLLQHGDSVSIPGSGRSPGGEWPPTPVFLPGKSHGQRNLKGYSPWGLKESDVWVTNTFTFSFSLHRVYVKLLPLPIFKAMAFAHAPELQRRFFVWFGFSKIKLGLKTLNQRKKVIS